VKIKICGITRHEDIDIINEALPDYIGFIFYSKSKRYVPYDKAKELRNQIDKQVKATGVFVNESIENIVSLCENNVIDCVQLHGGEDAEYCANIYDRLGGNFDIIKAVTVQKFSHFIEGLNYTHAKYILLDNGKGGTGKTFDWSVIEGEDLSNRYFLAGGVNPENIDSAIAMNPYCIDVSSGAKTNEINDRTKILEMVRRVRNAN